MSCATSLMSEECSAAVVAILCLAMHDKIRNCLAWASCPRPHIGWMEYVTLTFAKKVKTP